MEFIYRLTLIDRLFIEENWTDQDEAIISRHFQHLTTLKEQGNLILAGKTDGLDTNTIGIVMFQADSMEHAQDIMNNDPAIKEGIMTGFLQKYNVAIFNNEYKK